jgi:predicted transcriptional regulator
MAFFMSQNVHTLQKLVKLRKCINREVSEGRGVGDDREMTDTTRPEGGETPPRRAADGGPAHDGPSGTRGEPDPQAVSRFVEAFAATLAEGGMPRMPARVFTALLASEEGVLTSAELSEQLQVSPAAVSGAIQYLASVMMVTREREPGSRRERYRLESDQWYEVLTNREGLLRRWMKVLNDGVDLIGADSRPGRRIAETREFFQFVQDEFSTVMDRWREHREKVFGTG